MFTTTPAKAAVDNRAGAAQSVAKPVESRKDLKMPELYKSHSLLVPWTYMEETHKSLHFVIEDRDFSCYMCQEDAEDLQFWQAVVSLWKRAPLLELRLKEARDAIASLPPESLGVGGEPDDMGGHVATRWYKRDALLSNINEALDQ